MCAPPNPNTHRVNVIPPMDSTVALAALVILVLAVVKGIRAYRAETEQKPSP
jgi:hypothetical protein